MLKPYTIYHDNVIVHLETEKQVKEYIKEHKKVKVYRHNLVFDRTLTTTKVDRL